MQKNIKIIFLNKFSEASEAKTLKLAVKKIKGAEYQAHS